MKYNGYVFKILVENKELDVTPQKIKFVIKDSIHKLYPEVVLTFQDFIGLAQEYGLVVDGTKFNCEYTFNDNTISCPFRLVDTQTKELVTTSFIAGDLNCKLKHDYHWEDMILSKAYRDKKISEIITTLFSKYNFKSRSIKNTENKNDWYQPLMNNHKFIYNILLPNAYSTNSNDTPFFCYIDSNNNFNFTHYDYLINQNPIVNLTYNPEDTISQFDTNVQGLYSYLSGNNMTHEFYYRKNFEIDYSDGSLIEKNKRLIDYPKKNNTSDNSPPKQVPIRKRGEFYTGYNLFPNAETRGQKDNNLGRQIYLQKNAFFLDRMRITLPLNLKLTSGKTVNIDFLKAENGQKSIRFNGVYIIEQSEHMWNGENGLTILNIGRKNFKILSSYDGYPNIWGKE